MKLETLFMFEKKYNLHNRKILNINYWDFCRMNIFYELKSKYEGTNKVADICKKTKLKDKKIYFKQFFRYTFFNKKNIDLLFLSDPRRTKELDKYKSIFIDPIANNLSSKYNCMTIEEPSWRAWGYGMPPHFYPTTSLNLKYIDLYEFYFLIKKRFFDKKKKKIIENELDYLYKITFNEFNIDISYTKNVFTDLIIYFIVMDKTYFKLIKKLNPKVVLINYRPTYFKVLINSICRKNNIPTVDLQHGVISKNDPLERKNPLGYNLYSTSDYLFGYGEKLVDKTNLCFYDKNIKYVGFPFLENKINSKIKIPNFMKKNIKYILIISQSISGEQFAKFATDLADKLKNKTDFKIIFKYHPNELSKNLFNTKKDNIIEIKTLEYDIYQLQKYSYCQIGAYSTGLYEGLCFQLPTIILKDLPGADGTIEILKYIKKGVYCVKDANELSKILDSLEKPEKKDIDLLWKSNSLKNIEEEINKIIKNYDK